MTFPRYPAYKDSGVAWLGEIPAHWDVRPIKSVASCNDEVLPENTAPRTELRYIEISDVTEVEGVRNVQDLVFREAPSRARRKVRKGDIIVSTVRTYLKAIAQISPELADAIVSTGFAVLRPTSEIDSSFLAYSTRSPYFLETIVAFSVGVSYPAINASDILDIRLSLPPLPEQRTIAAFLDAETARIDTLVAKQTALIATLQEKRRALISHVVTKGLDPAAPMRDSGVPWLGAVPKHWEVTHLKRIARIRYGLGQPPREHDQGVPLIRATNIDAGKITERDLVLVDPTDVPESKDAFLTAGEIIVVRSGVYTGDSSIIPPAYEGAVAGYDMVVTVVQAIPQFVAWSFLGTSVEHQFDMAKLRAAQPHLNAEELGETWIVLPTTTEQKAIVAYIESETTQIDTLIAKAEEMIALLREHRVALIAAAVTGQIDVRGWVGHRKT